jgi:hypothetical protein
MDELNQLQLELTNTMMTVADLVLGCSIAHKHTHTFKSKSPGDVSRSLSHTHVI